MQGTYCTDQINYFSVTGFRYSTVDSLSITLPAMLGMVPVLGSKGTSLSSGIVLYPILRST